jgi:hypothetical protein
LVKKIEQRAIRRRFVNIADTREVEMMMKINKRENEKYF